MNLIYLFLCLVRSFSVCPSRFVRAWKFKNIYENQYGVGSILKKSSTIFETPTDFHKIFTHNFQTLPNYVDLTEGRRQK